MGGDIRRLPRTAGAVLLLVAAAMLTLAACDGASNPDDSAAATPGAQPESGGGFLPTQVANLPVPGGAKRLSPATEQDGIWTESFDVAGLSPAGTMQFYTQNLTGDWRPAERPTVIAACTSPAVRTGDTCRGVWTTTTLRLEVTAGPDDTTAGETQLNLVLASVP